MQPASDGDGSSGSRQLRRWGPIAAVVVVLALVAGFFVLSGDGDDEASTDETASADDTSVADTSEPGAPEPTGDIPITYDEAVEAGTGDDHDWGATCDPETGQLTIPSLYAFPCVPAFEGDNGGATYGGVTAGKIRIVQYDADESGELDSLLGSNDLEETPADELQTMQDYFEIYSSVAETYGREIEVVQFKATGVGQDEVAARADAIQIAEELDPFFVIGGPNLDGGAFAEELASRGVLCTECVLGVPECDVLANTPYQWGGGAASSQFNQIILEWLQFGQPGGFAEGMAEHAGDPLLQDQPRKFGLIHFEQDPPVYEDCPFGWPDEVVIESYIVDLAAAGETATELIAKMKDEGVTSIIFQGEPTMPIFLTGAATSLDYHPEWIFTGTVLTDTNTLARLWDQSQMETAFGLAQVAISLPQEHEESWSLYKWYFGEDAVPPAPSRYSLVNPMAGRVMRGIHMAGPDLTPDTFQQGMFRVPPVDGGLTRVQTSYGNWGFFDNVDYYGTDDMAAIWWDPEAEGPDEIGREGVGMWRWVDGGSRFNRLDVPDPNPFVLDGTVVTYDEIPPEDQRPSYPPPAGSPAAG